MKTFTDIAIERLGVEFFDERTVYDIGCHNFTETKKFLDLGASKVVGTDKSTYAEVPEGIEFIKEGFLEWNPTESIDILHMANVALFMENDKVLEKIAKLNPKVIIVQTMYDSPDPNWPPEVLKKLYFTKADDWTTFFEERGYTTIYAESFEKEQEDLSGNKRTFRLTDYIGEKK